VKKLVRSRAGDRCERCGFDQADCVAKYGRGLHVHRLTPGSPYTLGGCVLVCPPCHNKAYGRKAPAPPRVVKAPAGNTKPTMFRLGDKAGRDLDALVGLFAAETGTRENRTTVLLKLIHKEYVRRAKKKSRESC